MRNISVKIIATALLISATGTTAAAEYATSNSPLAFGPDQTIIDLNKVNTWSPLELEGFPPGAEIAVLRGDLAHSSESIVRVPAGYVIPNHNHTSDETYIWLKGEFTYINGGDGRSAEMSGQGLISLPGNAPPHAIKCGSGLCLFYLRYYRPFDHKVFPMPAKLTPVE
jgi:quercetin dioxygenase-like cupin family protein